MVKIKKKTEKKPKLTKNKPKVKTRKRRKLSESKEVSVDEPIIIKSRTPDEDKDLSREIYNDLKKGEKGIICSFGAGYSIGSLIVEKN